MSREGKATLTVTAEPQQLAHTRRFIRETAETLGAEESAVYDVVLAANEVITNVIVHGYKGEAGSIEVEMWREGRNLVILIRDTATPFDPTQFPDPDVTLPLEKRSPGGLGVYLTRRLMDNISYRPTGEGGNELTLVKRIID